MVPRLVGPRLVLPEDEVRKPVEKLCWWLISIGNSLRSPVLLLIRLYWGWQFFVTGKSKLVDLAKPTEYFASLGIPFPHAQAILVGCVECFGGLLLLIG